MAVAVGIALILLVRFFDKLRGSQLEYLEGWILGFLVPGVVLLITGTHMTLTWPISKLGLPFDDIIFGEPSLAFGILLLAFTALLIQRFKAGLRAGNENTPEFFEKLKIDIPKILQPMSYFIAAMGLACIAISFAGVTYKLFAAPAEEPISGYFADYPIVEALFISSLYALVGIGAFLFPFSLRKNTSPSFASIISKAWLVAGVVFTAFGIMNYFTHIGLIVNALRLKAMF